METRREHFLKRAQEKHKGVFSYEKFEYKNAKTRSIILCPLHGEFLQSPDKHLNTSYPCPKCLRKHKSDSKKGLMPPCKRANVTGDEFLSRLGDLTYQIDLSNFNGMRDSRVTLLCPKHGISIYSPLGLLRSKHKCKGCAQEARKRLKTKEYESFLLKAGEVHPNRYSYPEINRQLYKNRKSIIQVVCEKHGLFHKKAQKHLQGQGCMRCRIDDLIKAGILSGGYNKEFFRRNPEKATSPGTLYYLKIGNYYKIGITTNFKRRIKALESKSGQEVTVLEHLNFSLQTCYELEQLILEKFSDRRTKDSFSTELFVENVFEKVSLDIFCKSIYVRTLNQRYIWFCRKSNVG